MMLHLEKEKSQRPNGKQSKQKNILNMNIKTENLHHTGQNSIYGTDSIEDLRRGGTLSPGSTIR